MSVFTEQMPPSQIKQTIQVEATVEALTVHDEPVIQVRLTGHEDQLQKLQHYVDRYVNDPKSEFSASTLSGVHSVMPNDRKSIAVNFQKTDDTMQFLRFLKDLDVKGIPAAKAALGPEGAKFQNMKGISGRA